jgi:hypothetical protein
MPSSAGSVAAAQTAAAGGSGEAPGASAVPGGGLVPAGGAAAQRTVLPASSPSNTGSPVVPAAGSGSAPPVLPVSVMDVPTADDAWDELDATLQEVAGDFRAAIGRFHKTAGPFRVRIASGCFDHVFVPRDLTRCVFQALRDASRWKAEQNLKLWEENERLSREAADLQRELAEQRRAAGEASRLRTERNEARRDAADERKRRRDAEGVCATLTEEVQRLRDQVKVEEGNANRLRDLLAEQRTANDGV